MTKSFKFEKQQRLYHNKVTLSLTPVQRLCNQARNCKLDYSHWLSLSCLCTTIKLTKMLAERFAWIQPKEAIAHLKAFWKIQSQLSALTINCISVFTLKLSPGSEIHIPEILSDIWCSIWVLHHQARVGHLHYCYMMLLTALDTKNAKKQIFTLLTRCN